MRTIDRIVEFNGPAAYQPKFYPLPLPADRISYIFTTHTNNNRLGEFSDWTDFACRQLIESITIYMEI